MKSLTIPFLPLTLQNLPLTFFVFTRRMSFPIISIVKNIARGARGEEVRLKRMKIRIELDDSLTQEEVIIRCNSISEKVQKMQMALFEIENAQEKMVLYKKETEYYVKLDDILFFETGIKGIEAHTKDDIFQTKRKLYELEELLPGIFMRISKSAILNTNKVYAINRNLTASSLIEFKDTYKQVYVSRNYYKPLKNKLEEKRNTNQTG